ncbi:MAG: methyltransferase domain-containing protein [Acetobacteraceae bacterium]
MDEATKTNRIRGEEFQRRYLSGHVIDIGCGLDLVVPHAVPFDMPQGDAQWILDYFKPESFDCVHSSHCLEHMKDVGIALCHWWALVKPLGYLIIVVPEEGLYEQGMWPSVFNTDHKATFSIGKIRSWSPVSYDIERLIRALPGAEIIEARVQDENYDRCLMRRGGGARLLARSGLHRQRIFGKLMRVGLPVYRVNLVLDRLERTLGKPVDQTLGAAVAQIQVIAQKRDMQKNATLM